MWIVIIKHWVDHYTMNPSVKVFSTEEKAKHWVEDVGGPWTQYKEYEIQEHKVDDY